MEADGSENDCNLTHETFCSEVMQARIIDSESAAEKKAQAERLAD